MNQSLSARNIVKHYGGVVALSDGNLEVNAREVVVAPAFNRRQTVVSGAIFQRHTVQVP